MITLQVLQFICVWTDNEFIQKSHLPGTLNQTTNLCLEDIKTLWCFLEMHYWIVLFFLNMIKIQLFEYFVFTLNKMYFVYWLQDNFVLLKPVHKNTNKKCCSGPKIDKETELAGV